MEQGSIQERKLALAQLVRRESMENQMKMKQREQIFYDPAMEIHGYEPSASVGKLPDNHLKGFQFRMILAVLLFAAFLLCDANGQRVGQYSAEDVAGLITEDTLGLSTDQPDFSGLEALLDFEK